MTYHCCPTCHNVIGSRDPRAKVWHHCPRGKRGLTEYILDERSGTFVAYSEPAR